MPIPFLRSLLLGVGSVLVAAPTVSAHVQLNGPSGGEVLVVGSVAQIRWTVLVSHGTTHWELYYSTTGNQGTYLPIDLNVPAGDISSNAMHTYNWQVPATVSSTVRVRVVQVNSGRNYSGTSGADLAIVEAPATYVAAGAGCASSTGTVPALDAAPNSLPYINNSFACEATNLPAASPGAIFATGFVAPTPQPLDPYGLLGCTFHVNPLITSFAPNALGTASFQFTIPMDLDIIGVAFWQQAMVLDLGVNPAGAVMTNGAMGVIGAR